MSLQFKYQPEKQLHILDRLAWSEMFESFLAKKYSTAKRFGLEGCETLIPGMKALIDKAADQGVDNVVMGMPHRGQELLDLLAVSTAAACYPPARPDQLRIQDVSLNI